MAKLVVREGGQSKEIPLSKDSTSIGRTPENDLEVKGSLISRHHSSIVRDGSRHIVYDLGSSNGTYVNQARVEMKVLENGDVIRVGETDIVYQTDAPPAPRPAPAPPRPPADKGSIGIGGVQHFVQHVEDIAENLSFDKTGKLSGIHREATAERAAKDSKMFYILFQVGRALTTAASLDDMLVTAIKLIFEVIPAERGVILCRQKPGEEATPRLCYHRTRGVIEAKDVPISKTITSQVVNEKVSIITSDALQDPRFMQGLSIVQYNIRAALCVPLWEAREVYGAIYVDNLAKSYAFTKDDLELLTAIANLIATRIKQEETAARLRREEMLRSNLSKYHSPDVVNMLMTRGGEMGLEVAEREVSVVFIDVVASTKLAETCSPGEVAALLNEFFLMATNAVFAFKGNVNKFIGDEVMAIYNAPLDMPNHAESAVRTCLAMLESLEKFNATHPQRRLDIHCAVNTGPTVAGNVGTPTRMEYTVLGDTVNVASRLTKYPQVNHVVVGERTYEAVKDVFKAKDLGEQAIRGREKPMRAYEIIP